MERLPSELLHNIFIRVPLEQRLECMLVCRYWYNSLFKRSLLYDVDIKSDEVYSKFVGLLQLFPSRGSQVEFLQLTISSTFDKRILCNLLPNLRVFKFSDIVIRTEIQHQVSQPFELVHSNSKLEWIEDEVHCELTKQMIKADLCSYLTRLDLVLSWIENPREEIFVHLKNTPALEILLLSSCDIGITDLEIIHKNATFLEILNFDFIFLIADELPRDITPATSVWKFGAYIGDIKEYPDYPDWYTYLARKYTHLRSFRCNDSGINNANQDNATKIYKNGILPLYKNIGHHLDYFDAINTPTELNAFHTLDELGLELSRFTLEHNGTRPIFEQLAGSNQSKHAKVLTLNTTAIASPIMLQNFTSLTTLSIDVFGFYTPNWNVNLTDYLNAFPDTLTSFSAKFLDTEINGSPSASNRIEELYLSCSTLSPQLTEVISSFFPNLNDLYLGGEVIEDISINLPNNQFEQLCIQSYYNGEKPHYFSVKDADTTEPKYFIRDSSTKSDLESITGEEFLYGAKINVEFGTCHSLLLDSSHISGRRD